MKCQVLLEPSLIRRVVRCSAGKKQITHVKLLHIYSKSVEGQFSLFNTGNICRQMECGGEQYLSQLSVWQIVSTGYNYYTEGECEGEGSGER